MYHVITELLQPLLAFLLVLTPLVFIHELGHYLIAKACGVHVESFSIGFGPELFGWTDRSGTRWKVALFPLGGYVQMLGDANAASSVSDLSSVSSQDISKTLNGKTPLQRIFIAAAGPASNYLLAIILLIGLFSTVGKKIYSPVPLIERVGENSLSAKQGLLPGDRLKTVQGQSVNSYEEFASILQKNSTDSPLSVVVERPSQGEVSVIFSPLKTHKPWSGHLGLVPQTRFQPLSLRQTFEESLRAINPLPTLQSILQVGYKGMGGPIGIARYAGQVWQDGWVSLLFFMASISIALGFFNLLPIPLLDGGMILMSFLEIIVRRPFSPRVQEIISWIALLGLGSLFLLLCGNDLMAIPAIQSFLKTWGFI